MKFEYFFILLLYFLLTSCKDEAPEGYSVNGKWIWVRTTGGIAGISLTPETEGYTQTIEISPENNFIVYRNGGVYDEGEFKIVKGKSIYRIGDVDLIKANSKILEPQILVSFAFKADTLFLYEECYDCFNYVYVKKKEEKKKN